jgi:hypothetical protein
MVEPLSAKMIGFLVFGVPFLAISPGVRASASTLTTHNQQPTTKH